MSHCQLMFLIFSLFPYLPATNGGLAPIILRDHWAAGLLPWSLCWLGLRSTLCCWGFQERHLAVLASQKPKLPKRELGNDKGYPRNLYCKRPCFRLIEYHAQIAFHYRTILNHAIWHLIVATCYRPISHLICKLRTCFSLLKVLKSVGSAWSAFCLLMVRCRHLGAVSGSKANIEGADIDCNLGWYWVLVANDCQFGSEVNLIVQWKRRVLKQGSVIKWPQTQAIPVPVFDSNPSHPEFDTLGCESTWHRMKTLYSKI